MKNIIFGIALGIIITYLFAGEPAYIPSALTTIAIAIFVIMIIGTIANYLATLIARGKVERVLRIIEKRTDESSDTN